MEAAMIHVDYHEPDESPENQWYKDWKTKAENETARAIEAIKQKKSPDPYEFDAKIWTSVKRYLLKVFNGKCAYCESKIEHISSGDVEHYRPKKKVAGDKTHQGYYWLAYNLRNLFPSCEKCNRAGGKMNQFPVERHIRVYSPTDDPTQEVALLLNPYEDQPQKHLEFVLPPDFADERLVLGTICGLDEKGKASIRVFKLDRDPLNERRRTAQINIRSRLQMAIATGKHGGIAKDLREGRAEYSAACYAFAEGWMNAIQSQWQGNSGS
jgi:uncharacterized protein (TIGR02646 family)